MRATDIQRLLLGTFIRPAKETGTGSPRVEAVYGYLVRHETGLLLLDTGLGSGDAETEEWYRPRRVSLADALAREGVGMDDISIVVNCHLHFDHCGGNPLLAGRPVVCQRQELETARAGDYTMEHLVDYAGSRYELLDGEAEILAGQSHDTASAWSADALAAQASALGHKAPLPVPPEWVPRLLEFDPKRVVFAHDAAVWEPVRW